MVSFRSYFFQVSILGVLFFITPSSNAEASINDVCAKTRDPSFCKSLLSTAKSQLESTPGAPTADLKTLGKITLDLAHSSAKKTLGQIYSLISKTTDPKLKESYKSCSEEYDDAIEDLNEAETYFNKGDYDGMNLKASGAMAEAVECSDETAKLAIDPSVKKGNVEFNNICSVILAISKNI